LEVVVVPLQEVFLETAVVMVKIQDRAAAVAAAQPLAVVAAAVEGIVFPL
jgi:hypothetical protein